MASMLVLLLISSSSSSSSSSLRMIGMARRIGLLLKRAWKQNSRDTFVNGVRLMSCVGLAKVYSAVLGGGAEGMSAAALPGKISLITFGVISMAQLSLIKTLDLFSRERETVQRERARGQYSALEYVFSKVITELPIDACYSALYAFVLHNGCDFHTTRRKFMGLYALIALVSSSLGLAIGASLPSGESALVAGPTLMVIYMVLGVLNPSGQPQKINKTKYTTSTLSSLSSGKQHQEEEDKQQQQQNYSGSSETCPRVLLPLKMCSPIKWSIESLLCSEFRGLEFTRDFRSAPQMGAIALVGSGDQALKALGLSHQTTEKCIKAMMTLLVSHIAVAIGALAMRRQRHVTLDDDDASSVNSIYFTLNNNSNNYNTDDATTTSKNVTRTSDKTTSWLHRLFKSNLKQKTR
mmetsp:Transcript_32005/g.51912  ORF Transcript_32005/g.51912 Transcript_32005/m.51912 type:complete len:408 (-) Transcript_32005:216-1439(-)